MSARKHKAEVRTAIEVDLYRVVSDAVERGALLGVRRAHKHVDNPSDAAVAAEVENAVMTELCEVLRFPEP